jgi:hypothetical protein
MRRTRITTTDAIFVAPSGDGALGTWDRLASSPLFDVRGAEAVAGSRCVMGLIRCGRRR